MQNPIARMLYLCIDKRLSIRICSRLIDLHRCPTPLVDYVSTYVDMKSWLQIRHPCTLYTNVICYPARIISGARHEILN